MWIDLLAVFAFAAGALTVQVVHVLRDPDPPPTLWAYGHSYLAADYMNTPGTRYIERLEQRLGGTLHNVATGGAAMSVIRRQVEATWPPGGDDGIVVLDVVATDLAFGIPVDDFSADLSATLDRLGPRPRVAIVEQGHLTPEQYAASGHGDDATADQFNAAIEHTAADRANVVVVHTNDGWDPVTMSSARHPTDAGMAHIYELLVATLKL